MPKSFIALAIVALGLLAGFFALRQHQRTQYDVDMHQGINIGNALEAPRDTPWDVTMDAAFFDAIAAAGFDTVRLPVRLSDYVTSAPDYTLDIAFLAELDSYIQHALDLGLVLILDVHHFEELMTQPEVYEEQFYAIWAQLATHYQHHPKELVFELLNEPRDALTPPLWNTLVENAIAIIRATNPTRKVIVDAPLWGNYQGLFELDLPQDDHLIASFHYYEPMDFTFQSDPYHPQYAHLHNVTWVGDDHQRAAMKDAFQAVADWAQAQNVDVLLGEFGANQRAPRADRLRWTQAVVDTAQAMDFGWCYWEFGSQFGAYHIPTQTWDGDLLTAMQVKP